MATKAGGMSEHRGTKVAFGFPRPLPTSLVGSKTVASAMRQVVSGGYL